VKVKHCQHCNIEFEATRPNKIYCTGICGQRAAVKRYYIKHKQSRKDRVVKRSDRARPGRRHNRKLIIQEYKACRPCVICGESDPVCLTFHHRDPATKKFSISQSLRVGVKLDVVIAEMEKCDIICANCHLKLHKEKPVPRDIRVSSGVGIQSPSMPLSTSPS